MFTGIVQACVPVTEVLEKTGLTRFAIAVPQFFVKNLRQGASVAVDGVCLTVVQLKKGSIAFEAMEETLRKTTIGAIKKGQRVNVERSARMSTEIGGHIVSGHVTGMATIMKVVRSTNNQVVTFQTQKALMKYILPKGFIALDGVSLTVVDTHPGQGAFTVYFIPETLKRTTFGFKKQGDKVNLELDSRTQAIVDTVERYMKRYQSH